MLHFSITVQEPPHYQTKNALIDISVKHITIIGEISELREHKRISIGEKKKNMIPQKLLIGHVQERTKFLKGGSVLRTPLSQTWWQLQSKREEWSYNAMNPPNGTK